MIKLYSVLHHNTQTKKLAVFSPGLKGGFEVPVIDNISRFLSNTGYEVISYNYQGEPQNITVENQLPLLENIVKETIDSKEIVELLFIGKSFGGTLNSYYLSKNNPKVKVNNIILGLPLRFMFFQDGVPSADSEKVENEIITYSKIFNTLTCNTLCIQGLSDDLCEMTDVSKLKLLSKKKLIVDLIENANHSFIDSSNKTKNYYFECQDSIKKYLSI